MSIIIKNLCKRFSTETRETKALNDINFEINKGEFICILGPSGCGKSTLLNIVAGLEKASSGSVFVDDKKIQDAGSDRVVMFQESALFPWLTVLENVEFGMKMGKVPRKLRKSKALEYIDMVNLSGYENAYVHELSGGMRQRVALARALAIDSKVLLMDEPFAALDRQTKLMMQEQLHKIWKMTGKTILFVTHNIEEAVFLADRILIMNENPGSIKKEINVGIAHPRDTESNGFRELCKTIGNDMNKEVDECAKDRNEAPSNIKETGFLSNIAYYLGTYL